MPFAVDDINSSFSFFILPGIIFWNLVKVVLWIIEGFRKDASSKDK
jgi:hypothetical protein